MKPSHFLYNLVLYCGLGLGAVIGSACHGPQAAQAGFAAVPVTVARAEQQSVPLQVREIGTVDAFSTIQVKSQVAGELIKVGFTEGQNVNRGDLLFQIDPRSYEAALRQAQASVTKDLAQMQQAEANLAHDVAQSKNAELQASRYEQLSSEGVVSKEQRDTYRTNADALGASIQADKAAIASARAAADNDRAAVERARLDLSYCTIRSPLSGRTGNLLVHPGNLVKANGDNALVVINQVSPIFVNFNAPEQQLDAIRRFDASAHLAVEVRPSETAAPVYGRLTVIDNAVDSATGTIHLKATCANENRELWPGQFVNVVMTLSTQQNAVVVPAEAVQTGQKGQFVYVVKADKTVENRNVTVGRTVADRIIIQNGIQPGEMVVTDGQLRLFPGAKIQAVNGLHSRGVTGSVPSGGM